MIWHDANKELPDATALRSDMLVLWDGENIYFGGWNGQEWYDNDAGIVFGITEWARRSDITPAKAAS